VHTASISGILKILKLNCPHVLFDLSKTNSIRPMKFLYPVLFMLLFNTAITGYANNPDHCAASDGPILQILGSGGPIADDGRASTGYLILVDSGGGVFLRFGEAGARFEDRDHVAISHFHTDHSTDLVALLKSGYFSNRTADVSISGPTAGGSYPGTYQFLERLLDSDRGAYGYLDGYLDGSDGLVEIKASEVDTRLEKPSHVYTNPDGNIQITALGVPHGPVPALAYRIQIGQRSIVFSGDQNGSSDTFAEFARGADVLVMHMAVPEKISGAGRNLHAPPSIIGNIAAQSGAGTLVVSHFMARSLYSIEENLEMIRSRYNGVLLAANDLDCVKI
jgi:ribonuclease BN (tRNA processing enzyme)